MTWILAAPLGPLHLEPPRTTSNTPGMATPWANTGSPSRCCRNSPWANSSSASSAGSPASSSGRRRASGGDSVLASFHGQPTGGGNSGR